MIMFNARKRIKRPPNNLGNFGKLRVLKESLKVRNLKNRLVFIPKIKIPHHRHEVPGRVLGGLKSMGSKTIGNTLGLREAKPIEVDINDNESFAIVLNLAQKGPSRSQHFMAAHSARRERSPPQEVHNPTSSRMAPRWHTLRNNTILTRGPTAGAGRRIRTIG